MIDAIRKIVAPMIKPQIISGIVSSFSESDWTCEVEFNKRLKIEKVKIKSCLNDEKTGIFVEPKIGSVVLCCLIENRIENMSIINFSEIERIKWMSPKLELNGDEFGGILKIKEADENIKELKKYCEDLKKAVSNGLNAVGVGTAANGPGAKTAFDIEMDSKSITLKDMENKNITHG